MSFSIPKVILSDHVTRQSYVLKSCTGIQLYHTSALPHDFIPCFVYYAHRLSDLRPCQVKLVVDFTLSLDCFHAPLFESEAGALLAAAHEHVAEVLGCGTGDVILTDEIRGMIGKRVQYVAFEYLCSFQEYYGLEPHDGSVSETIWRPIVDKLVKTAVYLYSHGLIIRGIKYDSIKVNETGVMKLSDFSLEFAGAGSSKPCSTYDTRHTTSTALWQAEMALVYDLGIIVMELKYGPEFQKWVNSSPWGSQCFQNENWWIMLKLFSKKAASTSFKNLMKSMLHYDPMRRIRISEILSQGWLNENAVSEVHDERDEEFTAL